MLRSWTGQIYKIRDKKIFKRKTGKVPGSRAGIMKKNLNMKKIYRLSDDNNNKIEMLKSLVINYPRAFFHMTPAPHPIQRCSAGKIFYATWNYPGSTFHSHRTSAVARYASRCCFVQFIIVVKRCRCRRFCVIGFTLPSVS